METATKAAEFRRQRYNIGTVERDGVAHAIS